MVPDTNGYIFYSLGYGTREGAKIIGPESLVDEVKEEISRLSNQYR